MHFDDVTAHNAGASKTHLSAILIHFSTNGAIFNCRCTSSQIKADTSCSLPHLNLSPATQGH